MPQAGPPESPEYDVVVAGAGPAGSAAARAAAEAGASVCLLEKEDSVSETVRTSGVTWESDAERLGIPPYCYNAVGTFSFRSPSRTVTVGGGKEGGPRAAVLNVRRTYRWLARRAEEAGAEVRTGAAVSGALADGGAVSGVRVRGPDGDARDVRARVVIDATGFQSAVARSAGLVGPWPRYGAGAEYEARAERSNQDEWWIMVGRMYSPAGYAWIFPAGGDLVRVGVGVGKPESAEDPARILDRLVEEGTGPVASLGRLSITERHFGLIPNGGQARRTAFDGLLLAGDTAGQANPLVLEGIRYAVRFGAEAGGVAAGAAAAGDASAAALSEYERRWRGAVGSRLRAAGRVQDRWIGMDDAGWDAEIGAIGDLGTADFVDFIRAEFGSVGMAGVAARHPRMAARQLLGIVRGAAGRIAGGRRPAAGRAGWAAAGPGGPA